jgi:gliding motility-associated-like protein
MLAGISSFSYFKIYNRWGVVVHQSSSTDPDQGWDGRYKGKDQPADTYTWVVLAEGNNGRVIAKSGSLILIR